MFDLSTDLLSTLTFTPVYGSIADRNCEEYFQLLYTHW